MYGRKERLPLFPKIPKSFSESSVSFTYKTRAKRDSGKNDSVWLIHTKARNSYCSKIDENVHIVMTDAYVMSVNLPQRIPGGGSDDWEVCLSRSTEEVTAPMSPRMITSVMGRSGRHRQSESLSYRVAGATRFLSASDLMNGGYTAYNPNVLPSHFAARVAP